MLEIQRSTRRPDIYSSTLPKSPSQLKVFPPFPGVGFLGDYMIGKPVTQYRVGGVKYTEE